MKWIWHIHTWSAWTNYTVEWMRGNRRLVVEIRQKRNCLDPKCNKLEDVLVSIS
jgi:hypothetical protein